MDNGEQLTEQEKNNLAVCKEQGLPDHAELIDDVFYIWKTRFGLFSTMTKQGRKMLTGGYQRWCDHDDTLAPQV